MKKCSKYIFSVLVLFLFFISHSCSKNDAQSESNSSKQTTKTVLADSTKNDDNAKVTFVELGSDRCIPCKMMQPVIKAIEEEFGDQIKMVFHDVWKDPEPGRKYGIKVIPTQIFLDKSGKEFFRHESYFTKEEIEKLLVEKGLIKLKQVDIQK